MSFGVHIPRFIIPASKYKDAQQANASIPGNMEKRPERAMFNRNKIQSGLCFFNYSPCPIGLKGQVGV